jgi:hypothetical protein
VAATQKQKGRDGHALFTGDLFEPQILTTERASLERQYFAHAESIATPKETAVTQNPPFPLAKEKRCLISEAVDSEKRCLDVKRIPFSDEEDAMLQKAKEMNLDAPWSTIAAMTNRTENSVADGWCQHLLPKSNHQRKRSAPQKAPCLHQEPPKRTKTKMERFSAEDDAILVNAAESEGSWVDTIASWSGLAISLNKNKHSVRNRQGPLKSMCNHRFSCSISNFVAADGTSISARPTHADRKVVPKRQVVSKR